MPSAGASISGTGGLDAYVQAPARGLPPAVPPPSPRRDRDGEKLLAVRVLDNDHTTYEDVMRIAMTALGVSIEEAYAIAWTIDTTGSCVVAHAGRDEAEALAAIIRTIGIEVVLEEIA